MFAIISMLTILLPAIPQEAPIEPALKPPEETIETVKAENLRLRALTEELEGKLANMEEEHRRLLSNINGLDRKIVEMAREIARLQKIVKDSAPPAAKAGDPEPKTLPVKSPPDKTPVIPAGGPGRAITGEIMSNNTETGVILLRPGQNGGIAAGMKFEVVRDGKRVGMLMIDNAEARIARASVIEGDRKQIKVYDQIVEMVNPEATPDSTKKPVEGDPLGDKAVETLMVISGKIGDDYLITGETGRLQVGSKVYVYRDKKLKGILTIARLDRDGATARMTSDSGDAAIDTNDTVVLKERKTGITGIVKIVTAQAVAIDIGTDHGVVKGQVYVVERIGSVVGEIQISIVESYYSFAEPMVGSELSTFQRGDTVRLKN